jgi:hypothetical protein
MFRLGNVSWDGDHARVPGQFGAGVLEGFLGAGVDDEGPTVPGQSAGERQAEAAGGACDDRCAIQRFSGHFLCLHFLLEYNVSL